MDITVKEYLDDNGKASLDVKSEKTTKTFTVYKPEGGFPFYAVRIKGGGVIPKELSGQYTKLAWAKDALLHYLENMKMTSATERDIKAAKRPKPTKQRVPSK